MNFLKNFFYIIFFLFVFTQNSFAKNLIAYIDLDLLLKNSELGIKIYTDLDVFYSNGEFNIIQKKQVKI